MPEYRINAIAIAFLIGLACRSYSLTRGGNLVTQYAAGLDDDFDLQHVWSHCDSGCFLNSYSGTFYCDPCLSLTIHWVIDSQKWTHLDCSRSFD